MEEQTIDLFCLGGSFPSDHFGLTYHSVLTITDLPEQRHGILVLHLSAEQQDAWLQTWHQARRFYGWLLYVVNPSRYSAVLTDGLWQPEQAHKVWARLLANAAQLKHDDPDPMLAWLWLNESRRLLPVTEHQADNFYVYPLLNCMEPEHEDSLEYLIRQAKRGFLEIEQVHDRIRQCNQCHSSHLNYFESCPGCLSPNVEARIALHCFTCGHVEDQSLFMRAGGLTCPNCLTQLRHIGVDYDRPLETHHCNHCQLDFVEAKTQVRCVRCDRISGIDDLISQRIYSYRIGEQGRHLLHYGALPSAPILALNGNVDAGFLLSLLSWQNKLALRHHDQHLLLAIHLPGLLDYGERHGQARMFALTEQLTNRLNGLLRNTDVCCQFQDDLLLIFLPRTAANSLSVLQKKIAKLSEHIEIEEFTLRVVAWSLPDKTLSDDAAVWLQNKLVDFYVAG